MNELLFDLRNLAVHTVRFIPGNARRFELVLVSTGRDLRLVLTLPGDAGAALAALLRVLPVAGDFLLTGHAMRSITDAQEAADALGGDVLKAMEWSDDDRSVGRDDPKTDDRDTACVTHGG